jgi:hypothetical protein
MIEYLQSLFDELGFDRPWKPVSRPAQVAWLVFYVGFLFYAFSKHGGYLFIDTANLVVHEGGHNLFRWFGATLCLWGGTLLQWLVPFLLAAYFFAHRETTGFVFSLFFFFENWLYTATYMADARAKVLPLVTTGDSDFVEHDFFAIFTSLGVLNYDTKIAAVVRLLGWCGMIGVVVWFARQKPGRSSALEAPNEEGSRFIQFLAGRQQQESDQAPQGLKLGSNAKSLSQR